MGPRDAGRALLWSDRERRLRTPWRLLAHALLVVAVGVALVAPLGVAATLAARAGLLVGLAPGVAFAANALLAGVVLVVATLLAARYVDRRTVADLGLSLDGAWWRDCGVGLALGAGLQSGVLATLVAAGWATVGSPAAGAWAVAASLAVGAVAMAAVGVYEELLFRGYYLTNVAEGLRALPGVDARRGAVAAAALTAAAFGAVHGTNPGATAVSTALVAVYGAYLAAGYLLTGELGLPVGFHAAWNYVQGYVYGFPVSGVATGPSLLSTETTGPPALTGGAFGPEAGLVALAWAALSLPALAWWVRRTHGGVAVRATVGEPALRPGGEPGVDGQESDADHGE